MSIRQLYDLKVDRDRNIRMEVEGSTSVRSRVINEVFATVGDIRRESVGSMSGSRLYSGITRGVTVGRQRIEDRVVGCPVRVSISYTSCGELGVRFLA